MCVIHPVFWWFAVLQTASMDKHCSDLEMLQAIWLIGSKTKTVSVHVLKPWPLSLPIRTLRQLKLSTIKFQYFYQGTWVPALLRKATLIKGWPWPYIRKDKWDKMGGVHTQYPLVHTQQPRGEKSNLFCCLVLEPPFFTATLFHCHTYLWQVASLLW